MNKIQIDQYIPRAYTLLKDVGLVKGKGEISGTLRGYISSFGAAVCMGSLKSAVAFYSKKNDAESDRHKLMQIIYYLITESTPTANQAETVDADNGGTENNSNTAFELFKYITQQPNEAKVKESIYNAAIAVKLAMNMYSID